MDDTRAALSHPTQPPVIHPLDEADLILIEQVREELVHRNIQPPSWRETDPAQRTLFFDEIRSILIQRSLPVATVSRNARMITDALSGIGLLDSLLRDRFVEEIFVRNGDVAVEYDGAFHHLGKLADDRYFENLAIHVADQGGATLRGDRPAVLVDLPGGERFTAIVPRLSAGGTAINIRTFGRRVRTLAQMAEAGSFQPTIRSTSNNPIEIGDENSLGPEHFLSWLTSSLSGSLLIAGEMGSGKTTLLNALSDFLPKSAPVATLETFRELEIQHPFLLRTVAPAELPTGTPGVTLDWVLNIIYTRMNPAAILVGEVVGSEALQFLKATCLGRKAFTTIHGGTVEEALMRLEQLALAAAPELGLAAIRSMVAMGVDVVALMGRVSCKGRVDRVLQAIALLDGLDERGNYRLKYLYQNQSDATTSLIEGKYQVLLKQKPPELSNSGNIEICSPNNPLIIPTFDVKEGGMHNQPELKDGRALLCPHCGHKLQKMSMVFMSNHPNRRQKMLEQIDPDEFRMVSSYLSTSALAGLYRLPVRVIRELVHTWGKDQTVEDCE